MKSFVQIGIGDTASYAELARYGWNGLLVEAHPFAFASALGLVGSDLTLKEKASLTFLNAAVSDWNGFEELQTRNPMAVDPWCGLESGNEHNDRFFMDEKYQSDQYSFLVYVVSLAKVLGDKEWQLLAMDIQGNEAKVLFSLFEDSEIRPWLIDVECHSDEARVLIEDLMVENNYSFLRNFDNGDKGRPNDLYQLTGSHLSLSPAERCILHLE